MALLPAAEPDLGVGVIWKVQDIATFLRVSREQVRRLIAHHGLPAFDLGTGETQHEWRAYPEEVVAWTKRSRMRPVGSDNSSPDGLQAGKDSDLAARRPRLSGMDHPVG